MTNDRIDEVFFALADPTRLEVIRRLSQEGPVTVSDLARDLPVSRQAIAKHLAALGDAGLISGEQDGRRRRYHLTPGPLTEAMGWMADVGAEWDDRLDKLRRLLQGRPTQQP
jgi:DNA-binding transcriptional ArsR family regulator